MKIFELVTLYNALYIDSLNYKLSNEDVTRYKSLFCQAFSGRPVHENVRAEFLRLLDNLTKSVHAAETISDRTFYFEAARGDLITVINSFGF